MIRFQRIREVLRADGADIVMIKSQCGECLESVFALVL